MTSTERIKAVLSGKQADRIPTAGWAHVMNLQDRHVKDFTKATIDYQTAHQFDIIKVTSNPQYLAQSMGSVVRASSNSKETAFWCVEKLAVENPSDWSRLQVPDIRKGSLAREIEVIARLCDHYKGDVPVIPTIFSPLMWAMYFSVWPAEQHRREGAEGLLPPWEKYLVENEAQVKQGLEILTHANEIYMDALSKLGVAGFFFANPFAQSAWSREHYDTFAAPYDIANLKSIQGKTWFNIFHWCGRKNLQYDWIAKYPVQALNWEDICDTNPTMAQVRAKTDKVLVGGIDRLNDLKGADREEIKQRIKQRARRAVEQAGSKLLFAGGCTFDEEAVQRFVVLQEAVDEVSQELNM